MMPFARKVCRACLAILFAGSVLATAGVHAATPDPMFSATVGGRLRQWRVHVPTEYRASKRVPLVVAFHGHGSSARDMVRMTGLNAVADQRDFIVVYAQGVDRSWAAGVNAPADREGVDDVAFTGALLSLLERRYSIDTAHIVFTGFSNGAHLVQLLGCRMASRIDAIVPVSGSLAPALQGGCHPARPLTVVAFHGTDDPIDPYAGGHIRIAGGAVVLPVTTTLADWAQWDGCAPIPATTRVSGQNGIRVDRLDWTACRDGARVTLYRIAGGGHTWPGGPQYLPRFLIGNATRVINASEVIGAIAASRSPLPP